MLLIKDVLLLLPSDINGVFKRCETIEIKTSLFQKTKFKERYNLEVTTRNDDQENWMFYFNSKKERDEEFLRLYDKLKDYN